MKEVIVCSFNVRNKYWIKNWDGEDYPEKLAKFIKEKKIDIIGLQELTKAYEKKLKLYLDDYKIFGKYRYGHNIFLKRINEATSFVTNINIIEHENRYLTRVPFIYKARVPRVMTSLYTGNLFIINVHMEYINNISKKHQLKVLYKYIIKNIDKKIIIMGDFNMTLKNPHFREFINKLKQVNIFLVENKVNTYMKTGKEKILDHIFVSSHFDVIDSYVYTDKKFCNISDHRPIIVKIKEKDSD